MVSSAIGRSVRLSILVGSASLLAACANTKPSVLATTEETKAVVNVLKPASVVSNAKQVVEALTLPDLLYSGLQSLLGDRLLTPDDDKAFDFFARALAMAKLTASVATAWLDVPLFSKYVLFAPCGMSSVVSCSSL